MSAFERIKKIGSAKVLSELDIMRFPFDTWNAHVALDRKRFSVPVADDNLFNAANLEKGNAKRPEDKNNAEAEPKASTDTNPNPLVKEEADLAILRMRVRRSKLKKKLKEDPHNNEVISQLASVNQRLKNLAAASKARDTWAKNAEASHNGNDEDDDD